uniref:Uncharacterized protein n=1 Tax=Sphenodon punctatus TaxID=8508 RepID=A0A8D0GMJ1_SPHPU
RHRKGSRSSPMLQTRLTRGGWPPSITGMSKQLDMFKTNLEEFASKHKQEIRKNSQFRVQFQDMCATIGVDPLACKELCVTWGYF